MNVSKAVLAAALFLATPALAAPDVVNDRLGPGNPAAGRTKAQAELCTECHGPDGNSTTPAVARLAGQHAPYIIKQIHDLQSGARTHPVMTGMAANLDDAALVDIAAWFASNTPVRDEPATADDHARALYVKGDTARGIAPCAMCHGRDGKGALAPDDIAYPAIAGQHRIYLREQLLDWRKGARTNSPGNMMDVAKQLTDQEVESLAAFIAGM